MSTPSKLPQRQTVRVELAERSYDIHIGRQLLSDLDRLLQEVFPQVNHIVLIYDAGVPKLAKQAIGSLSSGQRRVTSLSVPSGEASKSVQQLAELWQAMLQDRTDRGSLVLALGGGVVGDLGGFAAASFARGIPLVQIPTTLLSQVDSSVGGKTGINLPGAKNIVGAFWQPSLVLIDSATLDSLPSREYVSGLAEVAKYGVILMPDLFDYLEQHAEAAVAKEAQVVNHLVAESCKAKAKVVQEDERETSGRRAILNYGHTFAHAIESVAGYGQYLHGEAVSIGMHMAALLALRLGRVDQAMVDRQRALLQALQLPTSFDAASADDLWRVMQHDKKVQHGKLRFILPTRIGHVELVDGVQQTDACAAIKAAVA